jgi:hypothetical protein
MMLGTLLFLAPQIILLLVGASLWKPPNEGMVLAFGAFLLIEMGLGLALIAAGARGAFASNR